MFSLQDRTQTFLEGVEILFGEGFGGRLGPQLGLEQSPPEAEEK